MLKMLVYEYKIVPYTYFMDEMQEYEIPILLDNLSISQKNNWIQTRYIMWSNLKPYLKKKSAKPEDIFPLPWDEKDVIKSKIKVDSSDIDKIRKQIMNRK